MIDLYLNDWSARSITWMPTLKPVWSLAWWQARLKAHNVKAGDIVARDGRPTLDFEDPEGQRLALVDDGGWKIDGVWEFPCPVAGRQLKDRRS